MKKTTTPKSDIISNSATKSAEVKKHHILLAPIVSEKSTSLEAKGVYTFWVPKTATKPSIISAVKEVYNIKPVAVRVSILEGKVRSFGRTAGRTSDRKKAFVQLPAGKTIHIHKGV